MKRQKRDKLVRLVQSGFLGGMTISEIHEALDPLIGEKSVQLYVRPVRDIGEKAPIKVVNQ